jgi:hypothetical protein
MVLLLPIIKGGKGGSASAKIKVRPGEVIHVFVGGDGHDGGTCPVAKRQSHGGFSRGDGGGTGGRPIPARTVWPERG